MLNQIIVKVDLMARHEVNGWHRLPVHTDAPEPVYVDATKRERPDGASNDRHGRKQCIGNDAATTAMLGASPSLQAPTTTTRNKSLRCIGRAHSDCSRLVCARIKDHTENCSVSPAPLCNFGQR